MIRKIPDKILEIVGNQSSFSNNVGMSGSEVLIYPDYVLKVQAESEETKNERDIVEWLDERLKQARWNVEHNLVDLENVEPETFGEGGFRNPEELLGWLEANRPEEDIVFTHGDFCLPNVFVQNHRISGFIDLGKMGPADRWQDIAIVLRSLNHNSVGFYNGGKKYFDFTNQMLLDELGIEMDYDKYRYYILLDELF